MGLNGAQNLLHLTVGDQATLKNSLATQALKLFTKFMPNSQYVQEKRGGEFFSREEEAVNKAVEEKIK